MMAKRGVSLLLAVLMMCGLGWPARAEGVQGEEGASSQVSEAEETGKTEGEDGEDPADLGFSAQITYDPTAALSSDPVPDTTAQALLLMDAATGTVLWEKNSTVQLEPASVTKIMTMLLVCEALDAGSLSLDTLVTTSAHAAGMGGSQVYLEEGEQMTVEDLLKAVAVASGNDAAVALGEAVAGSETGFVDLMNLRAAELGMEHTHFVNCTGLPAQDHVTCAYDIALMSRELLTHDVIRPFTGIWMDSLRDGAFLLSSTNRLVRTYSGCTGLKTGYTSTAGYCISATAQRNDMELIAVVLGARDSADRFSTASGLLDWGFGNFRSVQVTPSNELPQVAVSLGSAEEISVVDETVSLLVRTADAANLTCQVLLPECVDAPVQQGDRIGTLLVLVGDQVAAAAPLTAGESVDRLTIPAVLGRFFRALFAGQG